MVSAIEQKKVLFVTDQGSVKLGGRLYLPGEEMDVNLFRGREASLRELIRDKVLARRPGTYRATADGTIIKLRTNDGAAPLPTELDEWDPRTKRELRPITSEIVGKHDIERQLASLKTEQRSNALAKEVSDEKAAQEALAKKGEALRAQESEADAPESKEEEEAAPQPESKEGVDAVLDELAEQEDKGFEDPHAGETDDEFFGDLLDEDAPEEDADEDAPEEFDFQADMEEKS